MAISDTHLKALETEFFKGRSGPFRDYLGKYSGRLLILGDGRTVWSDYEEYDKSQPYQTMAVKFVGAVMPDIQHWAHLHPEQVQWLRRLRSIRAGRQKGCRVPIFWIHSNKTDQLREDCIPISCQYGGNSGMFAALVGIALGYDEITLAGCPSDGEGHYYDPPWVRNDYSNFDQRGQVRNWEYCRDNLFFGKVKSLSGNTREWLT